MGKSSETFNKREREKKRQKKRDRKAEKKALRKSETEDSKQDDMIAYVNHEGHLVDEKPVPDKNLEINAEDINLDHGRANDIQENVNQTGKVKFFNEDKGYGFINSSDAAKSYFVHISSLEQPVKEGDKVTFELTDGPQGPQAIKVKII